VTGPLYRLGRFCARHHWPVIGAWIVVAIAVAAIANAAGTQNSDNLSLPGTGSTNAQDLLQDHLPSMAYGTNPVVLQTNQASEQILPIGAALNLPLASGLHAQA